MISSTTTFIRSLFLASTRSIGYMRSTSSYTTTASSSSSSALPLPIGKINHVAIAVPASRDIIAMGAQYAELFGAKVSKPTDLPAHGVTTVFVEFENTKIELLHPLGDNSPIAAFLKKNPDGGIHHICVEVKDIEAGIARAKKLSVRPLQPKTKIGAHNKPVMFFHPKDCGGVLTEMEEE